MKKITKCLLMLCLLPFINAAQYDYFKWNKTLHSMNTAVISQKSGLATDIFNRTFYIDNVTKKVRWLYGDVISSAPAARATSNLNYINDPVYGDGVFYIGSDQKIYAAQYLNSSGSWVVATEYSQTTDNVAPNTFISTRNKDQVFYIRSSDLKVCNYWRNSSGSGFGLLLSSALAASSTSNIVHKNSDVYYIGNNSKLARISWNGSAWVANNTLTPDLITGGSKIQLNPNASINQVYYVRSSDNRICYYNQSNGTYGVCDAESKPVISGSEMQVSADGMTVFYIGTDNNFHALFNTGCRWYDNVLHYNSTASVLYNCFSLYNSEQITYFDGTKLRWLKPPVINPNYVYKKSTTLQSNGARFNAKIADYVLNIYRLNGQLFLGPSGHYDATISDWVCLTSATCNTVLDQHFQNIAAAGFNTIRFNGIQLFCDASNTETNPNVSSQLFLQVWDIPSDYPITPLPGTPTMVNINTTGLLNDFFGDLTLLMVKAANNGLKVNFFAGLENGHKNFNTACHNTYNTYLSQLGNLLKNHSNLFMYNLLLEADIYQNDNQVVSNKSYVCNIVDTWTTTLHAADPNHLVSLGVNTPYALTSWDPGIMNVDVMTFHLYGDMTNQTHLSYNWEDFYRSLKWTSNIMNNKIKKPWVIGETGVPSIANPASLTYPSGGAFNLVVNYQDQRTYGIMSLQQIFSAGASGYGWWQYKDVYGPSNDYGVYFGLVDYNGNNKDIIQTGNSIFSPAVVNGCAQTISPADYYYQNVSFSNPVIITGTVRDANNQPIADAYIIANENCNNNGYKIYHTFSDASGNFTLKTECNLPQMKIMAVGKDVLTVPNPVSNTTYTLTTTSCSSMNAKQLQETVANSFSKASLFPNPSKGLFTVTLGENSGEKTTISVFDAMGKLIIHQPTNGLNNTALDLSSEADGIYFVFIRDGENLETLKLVKQHE